MIHKQEIMLLAGSDETIKRAMVQMQREDIAWINVVEKLVLRQHAEIKMLHRKLSLLEQGNLFPNP